MHLTTNGKLNLEPILGIVWKFLVAGVLWWANGQLNEYDAIHATLSEQNHVLQLDVIVLKERLGWQRDELDRLRRQGDDR